MNIAAFAPLIVVGVAFVAFCIVDIVKAESTKQLPKWGWIVACCVSVPLGGIIYLMIGRDDR